MGGETECGSFPDAFVKTCPASCKCIVRCTAACLERASTGNWKYLADDVAFCFSCDERARYVKSTGPSTSMFACAACKEKPVKREPGYMLVGTSVTSSGSVLTFTSTPAGTWDVNVDWAEPPPIPTCAGPLATHGTPVLRVMGSSRHGSTRQYMLCDGCYLERERNVAAATDADACWLADGLQPEPYTEAPARVGTVPQVVSVGVGIWASRGMRP